MPPFHSFEYGTRIDNTKERMAEQGIDALVVTDPANMYYLTGYDAWSFYVHQAVLVIRDHDQPIWVGREMDAKAAQVTTWLDDDNILSYSDDYVQSSADKHPMDYIATVLDQRDGADGVVGTEMDAYYFTARSYERLAEQLPEAEMVDATLLVNWVRLTKTQQELKYMRRASRIVENAMETAYDVIEPGVRECDVAAEIYHALISGTDRHGGEYASIVPLMPTGTGTATPHLTWSDEPLEEGDPIIFELAGCKHRYHSPLARTACVGDPPAELERTADVIIEGMEAALDAIEPGATCEAVERAWRDVISEHGFVKESRIGYAMGLGYPPDWGEHTASFRPGDETVLEPNMTFHLIPGIWLDEYGVEISESIRVTSDGVEVFADYPRELFIA